MPIEWQTTELEAFSIVWSIILCAVLAIAVASWCEHRRFTMAIRGVHQKTGGSEVHVGLDQCTEPVGIAACDLNYWAPNGSHILNGVDLCVNPGEVCRSCYILHSTPFIVECAAR